MDFPPDPFLLLSHSYHNPFAIFLFTFPPFHPLFTPRSIFIARCSLFRFDSHFVVRSFLLRSPFPPSPLHLCSFFIYFWLFAFSSSYFVSLPSLPLSVRFFRCVSLLHVALVSFPPRTKSINSFTSLTPFTSLPFFASMHTCQRNHTHPKSYRLSCLTSFFSSTPYHPHARILSYFIPCWLPRSSVRLSPIPEAIPFPSPIHAHIYNRP